MPAIPYGLWPSPLSPRMMADERRLDGFAYDSASEMLVWLEGRSGLGVLVGQDRSGDAPRDVTTQHAVRAEVGYAGGDFTVHGGTAYFAAHKTNRLFRQSLHGGPAVPLTTPFGAAASPTVSPCGRWLLYVHELGNDTRLAVASTTGAGTSGDLWPQVIASGRDFYMQPRWSPDGRRVAWIAWDHPNMPWDGTELLVADVHDHGDRPPTLGPPRVVAGNVETAIFQPEFSPDGKTLFYVSDETGWGRIARHDLASGERTWLTADGVEHGWPAWLQDMRTYAVGHDGTYLVAAANSRAVQQLVRIEVATGRSAPIAELSSYTAVSYVAASRTAPRFAFIGSHPIQPSRLVEFDFATEKARVVARASAESIPPEELARCEPISWTTAGGETAHGLYYRPHHPTVTGIGRPPLVVIVHGGPTSQVVAGWRAEVQFLATRGYAVLLVNHRGSTGYGRPYMLRLRENWGVCDVEDSVSGAQHLAGRGEIDPAKTVILGGSAGGFTVLQTLVDQPEAFAAGVCLYGVSDQFQLAAQTHKFESRYNDQLLGPLPQAAAVYRARSPIFHAQQIVRPLLLFQGGEDRVVPQNQSDVIAEALRRRGIPVTYHLYPTEGHGWRKRETIEHYYQAVDDFLRQTLIFA